MIDGLFTNALASATRCCSPPESCFGRERYFSARPTVERILGTSLRIFFAGVATTRWANATFSYTFLSLSRRNSWKTQPILRRYIGTKRLFILFKTIPSTSIVPSDGSSSFNKSLIRVDFPEPLSPTIKTNSPSSIFILIFFSASTPLE